MPCLGQESVDHALAAWMLEAWGLSSLRGEITSLDAPRHEETQKANRYCIDYQER